VLCAGDVYKAKSYKTKAKTFDTNAGSSLIECVYCIHNAGILEFGKL